MEFIYLVFLRVIKFFIFSFLCCGWFFLTKKDLGVSRLLIQDSFFSDKKYSFFDFTRDSVFHKKIFCGGGFFYVLFVLYFVIFFCVRNLLFIIVIFFFIYYVCYLLCFFLLRKDVDLEFYVCDYKFPNNPTFSFLLLFMVYKLPKWCAFNILYTIISIYLDGFRKDVRILPLLNSIIFVFIMGFSWWFLYFVFVVVRESISKYKTFGSILYHLPCILLSLFENVFNQNMVFSKNARIFLFDNCIDLNGGKRQVLCEAGVRNLYDTGYVKIRSLSGNRVITHGGVYLGDESAEAKDAVLATGRALEGARYYTIPVDNYRMSTTSIVFNSFFDRNVVFNRLEKPAFIVNAHIDNLQKLIVFNQMNMLYRTMTYGSIYRESVYSRLLIPDEDNYSAYALRNIKAFSLTSDQVKMYDYSVEQWSGFSDKDRFEALYLLQNNFIDFRNEGCLNSEGFKYLTKGFFRYNDSYFIPSSVLI